jgi:hypothetical protein
MSDFDEMMGPMECDDTRISGWWMPKPLSGFHQVCCRMKLYPLHNTTQYDAMFVPPPARSAFHPTFFLPSVLQVDMNLEQKNPILQTRPTGSEGCLLALSYSKKGGHSTILPASSWN